MTHELIPGKIANIGGTGSLKPGQRRLCAAKGLSATPRVECDDNVSTISCPPPLDMCLVFQGRFAASADRAGALTQFLNFTERSCAFPTWPVVFYEFYGIRLRKLPVNKCIPLKGERRHKIDATLCTCSDSDMCNALDVGRLWWMLRLVTKIKLNRHLPRQHRDNTRATLRQLRQLVKAAPGRAHAKTCRSAQRLGERMVRARRRNPQRRDHDVPEDNDQQHSARRFSRRENQFAASEPARRHAANA